MTFSSFPISPATVLVADASVVINLNATDRALDIINAQPGLIAVTENAFEELARGSHKGHSDAEQLQALIDCGAVQLARLGDAGNNIYGSLVEGTALRTLDDGEAATIGYAIEVGGVALIDERKARSICANDFPELMVASTVDLLLHDTVRNALDHEDYTDSFMKALRDARMRVPPQMVDVVINIIGKEIAGSFNSLSKAMRATR